MKGALEEAGRTSRRHLQVHGRRPQVELFVALDGIASATVTAAKKIISTPRFWSLARRRKATWLAMTCTKTGAIINTEACLNAAFTDVTYGLSRATDMTFIAMIWTL